MHKDLVAVLIIFAVVGIGTVWLASCAGEKTKGMQRSCTQHGGVLVKTPDGDTCIRGEAINERNST